MYQCESPFFGERWSIVWCKLPDFKKTYEEGKGVKKCVYFIAKKIVEYRNG